MSGKDIYEQNKLLRAENDLLHMQEQNARLKREAAAGECADLAMRALKEFLSGRAWIVVNDPGPLNGNCRTVRFQMPTT